MIDRTDLLNLLNELEEKTKAVGPGDVMQVLNNTSSLEEAKQALGHLQGTVSGIRAVREAVVRRWEDK